MLLGHNDPLLHPCWSSTEPGCCSLFMGVLAADVGIAGEGAIEGILIGTEAGEGTLCGEWMNWPAGEGPPCCIPIGEPWIWTERAKLCSLTWD